MANISVTVQDGNNITLVSTPTPTQVITIDRGIAGPQGPAGDPGDPAGSQYQIQYNSGLNTFTASPNLTFNGNNLIVLSSSSSDAVRITQTGIGNALLVEDSTNPDATPFVINSTGIVLIARSTASVIANGALQINVQSASFPAVMTNTGSTSYRPHWTLAVADTEIASIGSTNTALTTYVGGIQRMLINALGGTLLSPGTGAGAGLTVTSTNLSGATTNVGIYSNTTFGSLATTRGEGFQTILGTEAATFTLGEMGHFKATQGTIGLNSVVTNQMGFFANSSLTGATNNYGFFSEIAAATGRFNFYANGTAANYFAGDVGIGTNAPSSELHIAKSEATAYNGAATDGQLTAGSTVFIQQTAGTNAGVAQIVFQPRTTFPYNRIVSSGGSVPFLTFVTNNSEAMRIDSVGKVGIGTTSQNTKLEVAGTPVATSGGLITILDTSATGLNSTLGSLVWASGPGTDFYIGKKSESAIGSLSFGEANNGTEFMRLDNSGNLGIGTAAPAAKLDVTESIAGAITTALMLRNPNSTVAGTGTKIYFSSVATNNRGSYIASANTTSNNNTYLAFGTNAAGADATERMRLDSAGNLGIGTTAPGAKVTAAAANAVVASRGTAYLYTTDSVAANFGGQLSLGGSYTGTTETIFGSIAGRKENGTSGDIAGYLQFSTTNLSLGNVERMRITSAGNVGIGTTSPNLLGSGTALTVLGSTTNRGLVELGSTSVTAAGVFGQLSGYNGNLTLAAAIQFAGAGATDSGDTRFFTKPSGVPRCAGNVSGSSQAGKQSPKTS